MQLFYNKRNSLVLHVRLATDVNEGRLRAAGLVGADVLINGEKESLKDRGE